MIMVRDDKIYDDPFVECEFCGFRYVEGVDDINGECPNCYENFMEEKKNEEKEEKFFLLMC